MLTIWYLNYNLDLFLQINQISLFTGEGVWSNITILGNALTILSCGCLLIYHRPALLWHFFISGIIYGSLSLFWASFISAQK